MFFFRTLPSSADSEGLDGQDDKEKSFRFLFLFLKRNFVVEVPFLAVVKLFFKFL